ncbi:MarR family winged helix-turn-helix transcriptional regulator [Pseudomonas sp. GV071]|uniref:MarR family winged helix-turn-helix transcriptional regulator n=1 Tax=Pseudomonas sp. GV071 TaxID=2135754 RepID=UPI000D33FD6A|nr:MarR family winged helix-turn-helix transcriptional regulator [Pseudomonas sp. GV071]PTQ68421.1 MarR family transcriptional regulator [Pseudomonas sp. GV071]
MLTTHCLCTKLRRAARSVTRVYDDALRELGLNVAQYSLLSHLQRLEQPSISNLAEAMGLDRSTLGRNLKVLENDGLVQMGEGSDLRSRQVQLTAAGVSRLERGARAWQDAQAQLALRLGAEKREALWLLLDDLETID